MQPELVVCNRTMKSNRLVYGFLMIRSYFESIKKSMMSNSNLGLILIVLAIGLFVMGYNAYDANTATIAIGDMKISAGDQGERTKAYLLMGGGVVALLAGLALRRK